MRGAECARGVVPVSTSSPTRRRPASTSSVDILSWTESAPYPDPSSSHSSPRGPPPTMSTTLLASSPPSARRLPLACPARAAAPRPRRRGRWRPFSARQGHIWENKNIRMWDVDLEAEFERQERRKREEEERNRKEAASGLGFGNLAMLDDMSVDLSSQLRRKDLADDEDEDEDAPLAIGDGTPGAVAGACLLRPAREEEEAPPERARPSRSRRSTPRRATRRCPSTISTGGTTPHAPSRRAWQREWEKGEAIRASKNPVYAKSKFSTRQLKKLRPKDLKPTVGGRELTEAEKEERRRTADDAYLRVKQNLLLTTAGLCGSGTLGAFAVGGCPSARPSRSGPRGRSSTSNSWRPRRSRRGGQGGPPSILVLRDFVHGAQPMEHALRA